MSAVTKDRIQARENILRAGQEPISHPELCRRFQLRSKAALAVLIAAGVKPAYCGTAGKQYRIWIESQVVPVLHAYVAEQKAIAERAAAAKKSRQASTPDPVVPLAIPAVSELAIAVAQAMAPHIASMVRAQIDAALLPVVQALEGVKGDQAVLVAAADAAEKASSNIVAMLGARSQAPYDAIAAKQMQMAQIAQAFPAATTENGPTTVPELLDNHKPVKVLIVGLKGGQAETIRSVWGLHYDLKFVPSEHAKGRDFENLAAGSNVVISMTGFISHSTTETLKKVKRVPIEVSGGMTFLHEALRANYGRVAQGVAA